MGGFLRKHSTPDQPVQQKIDLPQLSSYQGHPIEYYQTSVNAELDIQSHFSFMAPTVTIQATNEEQYFPELAAIQDQGYKMLAFVSFPGSIRKFGFTSGRKGVVITKFQGIFRKLLPDEKDQKWDLRVVKSTLVNHMFTQWSGNIFLNAGSQSGGVSDSYHIFQTLQTIAEEGGRLISVELTGMSEEQIDIQKQYMDRHAKMSHVTTERIPEMQVAVDVFFEIPCQPLSERYVYQVVSCPLESTYQHTFPHGHFSSVIDWQSLISQYLETGWKLVEILEDYSVSYLTQMSGFRPNGTQTNNCLWISEKPLSRLNDNTQYYEGTMVEHWVTLHSHVHRLESEGATVVEATDWEPITEHFGKKGWQVVRILNTPDTRLEGTFQQTTYVKQMIFFQRRVVNKQQITETTQTTSRETT
ncbi:uncharacterized protein LOC123530223 [Mercenaria mercenaria]|uniref:uncharacterized protein LOC123530223 n=1 Tax=Mercenaria mercenaria TaxID=6596 RepID=UPI00234E5F71|nr:uncharacterized protein LOC123530223 [Mercenaria mercenaria]